MRYLKKYFLFLAIISDAYAMQEIDQKQQLSLERKVDLLCSKTFPVLLEHYGGSVNSVIAQLPYKDYEAVNSLETVLRMSSMPSDIIKLIFSYIYEDELGDGDLFLNRSVSQKLNDYADYKQNSLSRQIFLIRHSSYYNSSELCLRNSFDKQRLAFPTRVEAAACSNMTFMERKLLEKILLSNSTCMLDSNGYAKKLSNKERLLINRRYIIQERKIPIAKSLAKKATGCFIMSDTCDFIIKSHDNLAELLVVSIGYSGATIKDRLLVAIPLAINCLLPDVILYTVDYGIHFLMPEASWARLGAKCILGILGYGMSVKMGGVIGRTLFPFLDRYNSGVLQLKKNFGDVGVRQNIRRDTSFMLVNFFQHMCAFIGKQDKAISYITHSIRFLISCFTFYYLQYSNPIDRGAPCKNEFFCQEKQDSMGWPYVLSDMKND